MITHTLSGTIDILNPDPLDIDLVDIAKALAYTPRWGGATPCFYSVADHCIAVAERVGAPHRLAALLHDAHEAYMGDVRAPHRAALYFVTRNGLGAERISFEAAEANLMGVILAKFGLPRVLPPEVVAADLLERDWENQHVRNGATAGRRRAGRIWLETVRAEIAALNAEARVA